MPAKASLLLKDSSAECLLWRRNLIVETVGPKGRVLIAFDPDEAGRKGMRDAAARLAAQVFVRTMELTD
jgi:hypothetical protein